MYKLAIDFGASNTKIAGIADGRLQLDMFKSLATQSVFGYSNIVYYRGAYIALGAGDSLIEQDKTERKYIEQSILLSTYKVFNNQDLDALAVDLGVGLPIYTYKSNKKGKLQLRLDNLVGTTIEGVVDNKSVKVKINSVKIYAEGYSAFLSVSSDIPKAPTTLIDWGYKTTDVVTLAIEDNEWSLQQVHTVPIGIFDILSAMREQLYNNDVDLNQAEIDQYLRSTHIIPTQHGPVNLRQYLVKCKPVVDKVFRELKVVMPNMLSSNIYMCGGGADMAELLIGGDYQNIFKLPSDKKSLYANVLGYLLQMAQ